ncbi:MAG: STAS domain-containing protein [Firmicutes bacterium]|nr:STAS domain-containing protein [Bacillota bacterium]
MKVETQNKGSFLLLCVTENLDGVSAPDFDSGTDGWVKENPRIIIDCTHLEYLSSAGIRSLLNLARKARAHGGSLSLFNPGEITERVLTLAGFANILPMFGNLEEAAGSLK